MMNIPPPKRNYILCVGTLKETETQLHLLIDLNLGHKVERFCYTQELLSCQSLHSSPMASPLQTMVLVQSQGLLQGDAYMLGFIVLAEITPCC